MINKKVKNASECTYNGIKFRSKLELYCYKYFLDNKVELQYEARTYVIFPKFETNVHLYLPVKQRNSTKTELCLKNNKILPITYTPDFVLQVDNKLFFIETKGRPNDVYPIKRKLFLHHLSKLNKECWFFEPHNQKQVHDTYNLIKTILNNVENF